MAATKAEILAMINGVIRRSRNTAEELTRAIAFATEYQLSTYIPILKSRLRSIMRHQLHEMDVVAAYNAGIVVGDTGTYTNNTGKRSVRVHTINHETKVFKIQYTDKKPFSVFEASPRKVVFSKDVTIPFQEIDVD